MQITKDRVVSIAYTLRDAQNQVLDVSSDAEPLEYLHGYENIIPGLERALDGKAQGDAFTVTVAAVDAFGERDEKLVVRLPRKDFEGLGEIEAGMQLEADTPEGSRIVTVTQVEAGTVTVDANHPMAGLDLTFEVTVAAVREASPEEIAHGHPHHAHHGHGHTHDDCDGCGSCGGCG
jgi:FKBP-type peptidyl-prolyl cis-trans isomerase SlyD